MRTHRYGAVIRAMPKFATKSPAGVSATNIQITGARSGGAPRGSRNSGRISITRTKAGTQQSMKNPRVTSTASARILLIETV